MSLSDLELHYDQASAVSPITQRKHFNTALIFNYTRIGTENLCMFCNNSVNLNKNESRSTENHFSLRVTANVQYFVTDGKVT
jgi:hypothetical protein